MKADASNEIHRGIGPTPGAADYPVFRDGGKLSVELNARVVIQTLSRDFRLDGRLVGLDRSGYLIVSTKMTSGVLSRLQVNTVVVVQYLFEGAVFGFKTRILNRVTSPASLVFLGYPDEVERVDLREKPRVDCELPAVMRGKYGDYEGVVVDLSPGGCRMSIRTRTNLLSKAVQVNDELELEMDLDSFGIAAVPVAVRNVEKKNRELMIGTQFVNPHADDAAQIESFLGRTACFFSNDSCSPGVIDTQGGMS